MPRRSKIRSMTWLVLLAMGVLMRPVLVYAGQGTCQDRVQSFSQAGTPSHGACALTKAPSDPFLFRNVSKQVPNLEVAVHQVSGIKLPLVPGPLLVKCQSFLCFSHQQSLVLRI
jgi:hypothetical protein